MIKAKNKRFVYAVFMCSVVILTIFAAERQECQAGELKWFHSLKEGLAYGRRSRKWIFVEISAKWCKSCHIMEKNVLSKPKIQNFLAKNFVNVKLDYDDPAGRALYDKYQAQGLPCILILEPSGKFKNMNVGAIMTEDAFIKIVKFLVKK